MGTKESLGRGSIQFMTAGTGIRHSEHNLHEEPLRFIQMWLIPTQRGFKPNYGSMCGSKLQEKNEWRHLVSWAENKDKKTPVEIQTDSNMFVAELEAKKDLDFKLEKGRQAYFLAVEGNPTVSGDFGSQKFEKHDAAELYGPAELKVSGPGHVLIFEMKDDGEGGRTDI